MGNKRDKLVLPKFLDVLLILDDEITYTKMYKALPRCTDYVTRGLKYLKDKNLIDIKENPHDARGIIIVLTNEGRDAQKIIITLYNLMGIRIKIGDVIRNG